MLSGQCVAYCGNGEVYPPPPPSVLPPGPPGAAYVQRVSTEFQLQGDIAAFNEEAFKTALAAEFASATRINLQVTTGSIKVLAEMDFLTEASARIAANKVDTTPVSTMQSVWFASIGQIVILQRPTASIAQALVVNESPPPSPLQPPPAIDETTSALSSANQNSTDTQTTNEAVIAMSIAIPTVLVLVILTGMLIKFRRKFGASFLSRIKHSIIPPLYPSVQKDSLVGDVQQTSASDAAEDTENAIVAREAEFINRSSVERARSDNLSASGEPGSSSPSANEKKARWKVFGLLRV